MAFEHPKIDGRLLKTVKAALFVSTSIIMMCGLIVFGVGIWTMAERAYMERLLGTGLYMSAAAILIASGMAVTCISFLGCLGAIDEARSLLLSFFVILSMFFILMIIGGILSFVFRNKVGDTMKKEMFNSVTLYQNETAVTYAWNAVQTKLKCCGMVVDNNPGYDIWRKHANFSTSAKIPRSCCKSKVPSEVKACQANPEKGAHEKGCYDVLKELVKKHAVILGGVSIAVAFLLISGIVLSCAVFLMIN